MAAAPMIDAVAPASPRHRIYIILHLRWFDGEFIKAVSVEIDGCIERFMQHLEDGLILPELRTDGDDRDNCHYDLYWNGIELLDGRKFRDIVDDHGMPIDESVDVSVSKCDYRL